MEILVRNNTLETSDNYIYQNDPNVEQFVDTNPRIKEKNPKRLANENDASFAFIASF